MITMSFDNNKSSNRFLKGSNLIDFPDNYTIIDLETTGLSPYWDSIIEVAAIKIKNNRIVDQYSSLTNDEFGIDLDEYITDLTGITQEMIDTAPCITDILPEFIEFIGDDIVIAHNAHFDINFLYDKSIDYLNEPFTNNFIDTMRLYRRILPERDHHRLIDLADEYQIDYTCAHRALNDCHITYTGFENLKKTAIQLHGSINDFINFCQKKNSSKRKLKATDIHTDKITFDITSPFYKKIFVFTGTLEKMVRKEAMQIVADLGGINGDNVTLKTNFLVLGNNDYCSTIKDGKSSKHKKAEQLKLKGQDIEIIPENVFYDMIKDVLSENTQEANASDIDKQISIFDLSSKDFYIEFQKVIDDVIRTHDLPENSIHLHSNISSKGKNIGIETSKSLCIFEPEYPPRPGVKEKIGKNFTIFNIKDIKDNCIEMLIRHQQFDSIDLPSTATLKTVKSDLNFYHVIFNKNDNSVLNYIRENILYCLANYESSSSFGCCSRFNECSDAKKCVHDNKVYSMGCKYRAHLNAGRIFYGKNRNV